MSQNFPKKRLDKFGVSPSSFIEEFQKKDPSTRRYLLNSLTLFASISPEQQHQILNDLIQSEIMILAGKTQKHIQANVQSILTQLGLERSLNEKEIADCYYRYYLLTGFIPEEVTSNYLKILINFILGIELARLLFSMSFVEQQRFFELQGNYSTQVVLFYRYIRPIRNKMIKENLISRDVAGNHYYTKPIFKENELMDYVFDLFNLEKILYLGSCSSKIIFDKDYVYKASLEEE
jgi:hypothetical protein